MAIRLRHVPFPIVVEETPNHKNPRLDIARRQAVLDRFAELGLHGLDCRVIIAPAIAEGIFLAPRKAESDNDSGRSVSGWGQTGQGGFGTAAGLYR